MIDMGMSQSSGKPHNGWSPFGFLFNQPCFRVILLKRQAHMDPTSHKPSGSAVEGPVPSLRSILIREEGGAYPRAQGLEGFQGLSKLETKGCFPLTCLGVTLTTVSWVLLVGLKGVERAHWISQNNRNCHFGVPNNGN